MQDDLMPLDSMLSFLSQLDVPGESTPRQSDYRLDMTLARYDEILLSPLGLSNDFNAEELFAEVVKPSSVEDDQDQTPRKKKKKRKAKKVNNPPRLSDKEQISSLRETVRTLTAELQSLRPQWQTVDDSNRQQLIPRGGSLWQQIALRQLESRRDSEEENAKLREMFALQVHEAKNLKRILKRRANLEKLEDMMEVKQQKRFTYRVVKNKRGCESNDH